MSYEHGTTHYNLPLTQGSDKRDWFDTNQAFEDVDAALFAAAESAESSASAVEVLSNDVSDLQNRMTTAEADIDNVEAAQATADEQIISLSNRVNTIGTRVEGKFNSVAVQDAYSPNLTYSIGDYVTYDGNLYVCKTAITTGEPFDADKWDAVDLLTLIQGGGSAITASDVTYDDTVTALSANNVQAAIVALKTLIDSLGGGSMPALDYANPLFVFDTSHTTYTADKECYIVGNLAGGSSIVTGTLTINGTLVASGKTWAQGNNVSLPLLKLVSGDVLTVAGDGNSEVSVYEPI